MTRQTQKSPTPSTNDALAFVHSNSSSKFLRRTRDWEGTVFGVITSQFDLLIAPSYVSRIACAFEMTNAHRVDRCLVTFHRPCTTAPDSCQPPAPACPFCLSGQHICLAVQPPSL